MLTTGFDFKTYNDITPGYNLFYILHFLFLSYKYWIGSLYLIICILNIMYIV